MRVVLQVVELADDNLPLHVLQREPRSVVRESSVQEELAVSGGSGQILIRCNAGCRLVEMTACRRGLLLEQLSRRALQIGRCILLDGAEIDGIGESSPCQRVLMVLAGSILEVLATGLVQSEGRAFLTLKRELGLILQLALPLGRRVELLYVGVLVSVAMRAHRRQHVDRVEQVAVTQSEASTDHPASFIEHARPFRLKVFTGSAWTVLRQERYAQIRLHQRS